MKKIFLATTLLAGLSAGAAVAADLPARKAALPPPPPPPPMWTGFYAGLNAGYGFGTNSNVQSAAIGQDAIVPLLIFDGAPTYTPIPTGAGLAQTGSFSNNQNGFVGGGQVGYNYQWGPSFVIGLEADIQGAGIRGTSRGVGVGGSSFTDVNSGVTYSSSAVGSTSVNAGVDWLGTVRGRVGYLFTPTMLAYATGGLTYGGVYANVTSASNSTISLGGLIGNLPGGSTNYSFIGGGNKSQTLVGWNVGGGLEWMFMPNWSLKAEGLYWNMGNMNVPTYSIAAAPFAGAAPLTTFGGARVNYQGVIARAGLNYHFNFGGSAPIVANY